MHHPWISAWPPGWRAALASVDELPWIVQQLAALPRDRQLEQALRAWSERYPIDCGLLVVGELDPEGARAVAKWATPALAFLRGIVAHADPEVAKCRTESQLQALIASRARAG